MVKSFIFFMFFCLLIVNCTRIIYLDAHHVIDNKYDSEFPNVPTSEYLEEIGNSVKLVNILVRYRTYDLSLASEVTKEDLDEEEIKDIALNKSYVTSPASGTATVIYNNSQKIALLSCAHIFNFPDTVIINHLDNQGNSTPYIESIYFKIEQEITVRGLPETTGYRILISDFQKDIAVIGKNYKDSKMISHSPFKYPKGKASELKAGTFVFLFGYPRGNQMVSKAIVGHANRDSEHSFIIDAAVHSGISGGPVFALRDGAPNFEMVGMVFATAGEMLQFLGPEDTELYGPNKKNKYQGDIYIRSTRQIVYGITYAKSMESIEKFFSDNYDIFVSEGYNSGFFLENQ